MWFCRLLRALQAFLLLSSWCHIKDSEAFGEQSVTRSSPITQRCRAITITKPSLQLSASQNLNDETQNSIISRRKLFGSVVGATVGTTSLAWASVAAADSNSMASSRKRAGGLADKIRGILKNMDELQRDLMQVCLGRMYPYAAMDHYLTTISLLKSSDNVLLLFNTYKRRNDGTLCNNIHSSYVHMCLYSLRIPMPLSHPTCPLIMDYELL
jgi:hypothetical protein